MNKPIVSLQPTKGIVTECAARIYAAYITSGRVEADTEHWLRRSIQEAIAIARAVDDAIQSDNELPVESPVVIQPRDQTQD
jgi:hypothetical protein